MAVGIVIFNSKGELCYQRQEKLAWGTNSIAEYEALIRGLEWTRELGYKKLRVSVDSQLLFHQISGAYRVKAKHLKSLHRQARSLMQGFDYVELAWHARETPEAQIADGASKGKTYPLGMVLAQPVAPPPPQEVLTVKTSAKEPPPKLPPRRLTSFQDLGALRQALR